MRHRKHTFKVGRTSSHRKALLSNLVCSLFQEGRIQTTVTKAKEARRLAEKMITLGKRGTLHDRRRAIANLRQPNVVAKMFAEIAPRYQERNGGYTRILKLGRRQGDAAEMCVFELVTEPLAAKTAAPETVAEVVAEPVAVEATDKSDA
jgi:large subunit ribosomal protein L17